jgi:hypothetical protein
MPARKEVVDLCEMVARVERGSQRPDSISRQCPDTIPEPAPLRLRDLIDERVVDLEEMLDV